MSYRSPDRFVEKYAKDLSKVIILDPKTEKDLVVKYKKTKDKEAQRRLIESGLRFVVTIAKKYSKDPEQQKALILAGNEGIVIALEKYELGKGTRFLSYAAWWVLHYVREELNKSSTVFIPVWRKKATTKVKSAEASFISREGRKPSIDEIQGEVNLSAEQIRNILGISYTETSVQEYPPEIADAILADDTSTEEMLCIKQKSELIRTIIKSLPARDKFILEAYYGLTTGKPLALKQIASVLCLSSERVRQLKLSSLDYVREILKHYGIEDLSDVLG